MVRSAAGLIAVILAASACAPAAEGGARDRLILRGATLIDGTGAAPLPGATIVIDEGRISSIATDADPGPGADPGAGEVLDVAGRWVIPGLIDAHVHLATDPAADGWRRRTEAELAALLRGGVTRVRDMGGDARVLGELDRAIASGALAGPRIHFSAIAAGPPFFDDPRVRASSRGVTLGDAAWARAVTTDTDLADAARAAARQGAAGIKAYAAVPPELLTRLGAAAHAAGLPFWAHATVFPARPSEAVEAGVDVLSHAAYLVWEGSPPTTDFTRRASGDFERVTPDDPSIARLLALMAERGTLLDATLAVTERASGRDAIGPQRAAWAREVTARAHRAGVRIVAGTDLSGEPEGPPALLTELAALVDGAGLGPLEALIAATRHAAIAIGVEADVGTLEAGKIADLVVLEADPLADIRNAGRVSLVVQAGRRVRPR